MARMYSQRGKWSQAEPFFESALMQYSKDKIHNEQYWLNTQLNLGSVYGHTKRTDLAIRTFVSVQNYIEKSGKQYLYPFLYANALNDIAVNWINTDKDNYAALLVQKSMQIGEELEDNQILCNGLRIEADRNWGKKKYKDALELYLNVLNLSSDVLGNIREACLSSMNAAICFSYLGEQYHAIKLIGDAEYYANYLGDVQLIDGVKHNEGFILRRWQGESPTGIYQQKLIDDAKRHANEIDPKEFD
jgi:hypothetical protein